MTFFISPAALKRLGILGMNRRNVGYISRYNPRHLYPVVDDKLKTKQLAQQAGIAVPPLLGVVEALWQIRHLEAMLAPLHDFVIKPTRGSGGKGIWVIVGRRGEHYVKANGSLLTSFAVHRHINNILGGLYSLGGKPDCAMIEDRVACDTVFDDYTFGGVPDVRVIVFRGFPVMAMLRCSTEASDGRANLHQGAIGVGIDLASGTSLKAVQRGRLIVQHPDTGRDFSTLRVPQWRTILELASGCYDITKLGYIGCDIVLDKHRGPMILELNARPGLAIQLANGVGLLPRLKHIEQLEAEAVAMAVSARVDYAQQQWV